MDNVEYEIRVLDGKHDKSSFHCGVFSLDRYILQQAKQDIKRDIAIVYGLTLLSTSEVIGYYTLSAISIELKNLPDSETKKLPRYPLLPATLIGRLAVDKKFQGQGIGQLLLIHALKTSLENSSIIASMAVIVDAKDKKAIEFYKHFGFIPFSNSLGKLFLSMKTLKSMGFT